MNVDKLNKRGEIFLIVVFKLGNFFCVWIFVLEGKVFKGVCDYIEFKIVEEWGRMKESFCFVFKLLFFWVM